MSEQNLPPGLIQPTMAALPPGAQNFRHAGIIEANNANQKLLAANNIAKGGRRKRRYKGGADAIPIPQFQMQYTPVGGPGSSPNEQLLPLQSNSMQSIAWAANDSKATSSGGSRRRYKKGGNPDWIWGCYNGGKRRTKRRRNNRVTRKNKRKTQTYNRRSCRYVYGYPYRAK